MNSKNTELKMEHPKKTKVANAVSEMLSDVANAERFAQKHVGKLAFVAQRQQWLQFDEHAWKHDESRYVIQHAIQVTEDMLVESSAMLLKAYQEKDKTIRDSIIAKAIRLQKHMQASQAKPKLEAMVALASTFPEITVMQSQLDNNNMLFGVQNGVLELDTGTFRNGSPEDLITRQSKTDWKGGDEEIGCPVFENFLREVQPDPDVRHWLQKFIGYCLTGCVDEQIFVIFQGGGSNGKSVFMEAIKKVLGEYARTVQFDTFVHREKAGSEPRNDLAALDKVRLVVANEGAEGARLDECVIKACTGDDKITARFLHKEFFEYEARFKVVLITNHKPVIAGTDNGIWRRVILVPWTVTIAVGKRDKKLKEKLEQELPGILAWCMKGLHLFQEQGLSDLPKPLISSNEEYRKDSDIVGMWIDECCELHSECFTSNPDIYESYDKWAKSFGFRPLSQKSLAEKFKERGLVKGKGSGERGWNGIRLLPTKERCY